MRIMAEKSGSAIVFAVEGRLDSSNSADLESVVEERIEQGERYMLFDLAQLSYVSSSGLRVLLSAAKKLRPGGGKVVLAALQEPVREVLEITGFTAIFEVFDCRGDALAALDGGS